MTAIQAPRRLQPVSRTGKPKPGYVFKMLRVKGFTPFAPTSGSYHQERIRHEDGTWTDVQLRTDLHGVPITRQMVNGELQDVTWWHGRVSGDACTGCTLADGQVRPIVRTTRAARHRQDNRVPTVKTAGGWHLSCLRVKLANVGRNGRDTRQTAGRVTVSK